MTFEELYFSKCKYSRRIIDIQIGKKRIEPLYGRFSLRYYRFQKKYEDFANFDEYREYILSRPKLDLYFELNERIKRRFTGDEWELINAEHQRQKFLKRIRREEMYKNEYDFQDIPAETKKYLELIEVLIMRRMGFNMTAIGEELHKSFSWVAKRYGERIKNDTLLNNHLNNLKIITEEIINTLKYIPSGYYANVDEAIREAMSNEQPKAIIECAIESCQHGCVEIMKELEFPDYQKGQVIKINNQTNFCETFRQCISELTPREAEILERYYGCSVKRETLKFIAQSKNVSIERIRQIRNKAIRKMRYPSRRIRLMKEYYFE